METRSEEGSKSPKEACSKTWKHTLRNYYHAKLTSMSTTLPDVEDQRNKKLLSTFPKQTNGCQNKTKTVKKKKTKSTIKPQQNIHLVRATKPKPTQTQPECVIEINDKKQTRQPVFSASKMTCPKRYTTKEAGNPENFEDIMMHALLQAERSLGNESADMKTFMASDEDTAEQRSRAGCVWSPIEQPRDAGLVVSPIEQPRHAVEQPTHLSDIVNSPIEEKVDNCTLLSPKKQRQFAYSDSFSPIEQCRRAQIQTDHYLPLIDNVEKLTSPCKDVSLCGSLTLSPLVEPRLIKNSTLLDGGFAKQANDVTDFFELSSIEYNKFPAQKETIEVDQQNKIIDHGGEICPANQKSAHASGDTWKHVDSIRLAQKRQNKQGVASDELELSSNVYKEDKTIFESNQCKPRCSMEDTITKENAVQNSLNLYTKDRSKPSIQTALSKDDKKEMSYLSPTIKGNKIVAQGSISKDESKSPTLDTSTKDRTKKTQNSFSKDKSKPSVLSTTQNQFTKGNLRAIRNTTKDDTNQTNNILAKEKLRTLIPNTTGDVDTRQSKEILAKGKLRTPIPNKTTKDNTRQTSGFQKNSNQAVKNSRCLIKWNTTNQKMNHNAENIGKTRKRSKKSSNAEKVSQHILGNTVDKDKQKPSNLSLEDNGTEDSFMAILQSTPGDVHPYPRKYSMKRQTQETHPSVPIICSKLAKYTETEKIEQKGPNVFKRCVSSINKRNSRKCSDFVLSLKGPRLFSKVSKTSNQKSQEEKIKSHKSNIEKKVEKSRKKSKKTVSIDSSSSSDNELITFQTLPPSKLGMLRRKHKVYDISSETSNSGIEDKTNIELDVPVISKKKKKPFHVQITDSSSVSVECGPKNSTVNPTNGALNIEDVDRAEMSSINVEKEISKGEITNKHMVGTPSVNSLSSTKETTTQKPCPKNSTAIHRSVINAHNLDHNCDVSSINTVESRSPNNTMINTNVDAISVVITTQGKTGTTIAHKGTQNLQQIDIGKQQNCDVSDIQDESRLINSTTSDTNVIAPHENDGSAQSEVEKRKLDNSTKRGSKLSHSNHQISTTSKHMDIESQTDAASPLAVQVNEKPYDPNTSNKRNPNPKHSTKLYSINNSSSVELGVDIQTLSPIQNISNTRQKISENKVFQLTNKKTDSNATDVNNNKVEGSKTFMSGIKNTQIAITQSEKNNEEPSPNIFSETPYSVFTNTIDMLEKYGPKNSTVMHTKFARNIDEVEEQLKISPIAECTVIKGKTDNQKKTSNRYMAIHKCSTMIQPEANGLNIHCKSIELSSIYDDTILENKNLHHSNETEAPWKKADNDLRIPSGEHVTVVRQKTQLNSPELIQDNDRGGLKGAECIDNLKSTPKCSTMIQSSHPTVAHNFELSSIHGEKGTSNTKNGNHLKAQLKKENRANGLKECGLKCSTMVDNKFHEFQEISHIQKDDIGIQQNNKNSEDNDYQSSCIVNSKPKCSTKIYDTYDEDKLEELSTIYNITQKATDKLIHKEHSVRYDDFESKDCKALSLNNGEPLCSTKIDGHKTVITQGDLQNDQLLNMSTIYSITEKQTQKLKQNKDSSIEHMTKSVEKKIAADLQRPDVSSGNISLKGLINWKIFHWNCKSNDDGQPETGDRKISDNDAIYDVKLNESESVWETVGISTPVNENKYEAEDTSCKEKNNVGTNDLNNTCEDSVKDSPSRDPEEQEDEDEPSSSESSVELSRKDSKYDIQIPTFEKSVKSLSFLPDLETIVEHSFEDANCNDRSPINRFMLNDEIAALEDKKSAQRDNDYNLDDNSGNDVSDKDEDPTVNEDIEEVSSSSDNADDADTEDSDDVDNPQDQLVKIRAAAERSPVRHISTLDSRRPQKRRRLQKKMPIKCSTHLFPDVAPNTESHQSGITHGHSRAVAQCLGIRRVRTFTSTPINSPPSNNTSLDVSAVASPQCDSFELAINSTSEVNSEEIHVDSYSTDQN